MRKVLYILGQLEDGDVAWLSRTGMRADPAEGDVLITQGVAANDIFIVLQGTLAVSIGGRTVAELGPGELVGEMSLVDRRPPSATVKAGAATSVLAIGREPLRQKLETDMGFAARFYRAIAIFLSARMRASATQMGDGSANGRILNDEDEMDLDVLDNVHLAGLRFEAMIKTLSQAR